MDIVLKEDGSKGYAIAQKNNERAGMMSFSKAGTDTIIIDHTEVEPEYNGKGVGKQMLFKIVEMARDKNIKIIPLCPFAANMFKKIDVIKDVLK